MSERVRIGLLGCGTVGSEVARLLAHDPRLAARYEVVAIAVRDLRKRRGPHAGQQLLTTDPVAVAARPDVDVVVEVMGGTGAAGEAVEAALQRGAPVVTANKTLVGERGPELRALASRAGTDVRYEAAVAGAVPVIEVLTQLRRTDRVTRLEGVLNGTCTFVLSEMEATGVDLAEAVTRAQELGYAEADPTRDLDGTDAADKIAVLAQLAWDADARTSDVQRLGIDTLRVDDLAQANRQGRTWRLVAAATGGECLVVEPRLLDRDHHFARLRGPENALTITGEYAGQLTLIGPGAGGLATASAVIADLGRFTTPEPSRPRLAVV